MQYVSIDIETTGLDPKKNQIVEVGAVLDHIGNKTPIEELPTFRAVLIHEEMQINTFCANLHRGLWPEALAVICEHKEAIDRSGVIIVNGSYYCVPEMLEFVFHRWLNDMMQLGIEYYDGLGGKIAKPAPIKINVAGKNFGTFDMPFIEALPGWMGTVKFRRRILDPAILYAQAEDEHLPDLQETMKRADVAGTVCHTAVGDAIDIVKVIRKSFS